MLSLRIAPLFPFPRRVHLVSSVELFICISRYLKYESTQSKLKLKMVGGDSLRAIWEIEMQPFLASIKVITRRVADEKKCRCSNQPQSLSSKRSLESPEKCLTIMMMTVTSGRGSKSDELSSFKSNDLLIESGKAANYLSIIVSTSSQPENNSEREKKSWNPLSHRLCQPNYQFTNRESSLARIKFIWHFFSCLR